MGKSHDGEERIVSPDEVRVASGQHRLFWPGDLEEISSPQPRWWRSLLGEGSAE
jgi:hypothetical protein